jgi:REP element-mobilizing transposase RayT
LPHWQIPGATYWITFASKIGTLTDAERDTVLSAVHFWDGKKMDLHAAVVMPDHVHILLTPRETPECPGAYYNLSELMQSIKSYSGAEISRGRGGVGQVWVHESFDRWVRNVEDFEEKWRYITQNPVKEGLAPTPSAYRWWHAVDVLDLGIGVAATEQTPRPPVIADPHWRTSCDVAAPELGKAEPCLPRRAGEDQTDEAGKAELCPPPQPAVCFIKHTNACGSSADTDPIEAYRKAYLGDPNAAMGGILAVNFPVTVEFATAVMETYQRWGKDAGVGGFFVEVWLAPQFDEQAIEVIRTAKKWGQRVRLLDVGDLDVEPDPAEMDFKRIAGGALMQSRDLVGLNEDQWKVVTDRHPTESELKDLRLAWLICKHTKSNAITVCNNGMLIGNGAGQMSRVMSCRIATWLAKENGHTEQLKGAVAASDAFFPFRDGPDILADAGVTALIQPGGSKRDEDTIAACNERGLAMIFTGTRHFRH